MTDSAIKYVGVDGCKAGWIGVGLDDGDGARVKVREKFSEILECFEDARLILVDIPIGLLEEATRGGRDCDKEARKVLPNKRKPSVFSAPTRQIMNEIMEIQEWRPGLGITKQTFGIIPKIAEVNKTLSSDENASPKVREAHPEICFWALNGGESKSEILNSNKKTALGFWQRFRAVRLNLQDISDVDIVGVFEEVRRRYCQYTRSQVADDDILDALALAITAKLGWRNGFRRLPKDLSPDRKEPPEMVYALRNNTESASGSEK